MSGCCGSGYGGGGGGAPPPPADGSAVLGFSAGSVAATITTRSMYAWSGGQSLAQISTIHMIMPRAGTLQNLFVRQDQPAGNGNLIVYTVRVNNVATALLVSIASTATSASDLVNTVVVAQGDLVDIEITKALAIGTSPQDIQCTVELTT